VVLLHTGGKNNTGRLGHGEWQLKRIFMENEILLLGHEEWQSKRIFMENEILLLVEKLGGFH
jgi:hypothetical protein